MQKDQDKEFDAFWIKYTDFLKRQKRLDGTYQTAEN